MTASLSDRHQTPARLRLNRGFRPCDVEPGDEFYPNGIFVFNITRLLAFVRAQPERFPIEAVEVVDIYVEYWNSKLEPARRNGRRPRA